MLKRIALVAAFVLGSATFTASVAFAVDMETMSNKSSAAQIEPIKLVETKKVCMVTNRFFGTEQIPVQVKDQTYYGCCDMCKKNLTENETTRYATDPFSGNKVDKAKAVIASLPDGAVLYFESKKNFESYRKANNL